MAIEAQQQQRGLRRSGPNPLFFSLLALAAGAMLAAAAIPPQRVGVALNSVLVYRVEAAGVIWLVGYLIVAGVWLGWHRRLFKRLPVPGMGDAETPDYAQTAVDELEKQIAEMTEFRRTTLDAVTEVKERVARLEGRLDG
jgi:hypothetical protein